VRAVVGVKGQGDLLIYSSMRPVSIKARKVVRRLSVEESAAQAVAEVVGARGGRREEPLGGAGGGEGAEDVSSAEDGAAVMGLGQSPWVESGESTEWPFEYDEKTGELVVTLPPMKKESRDSGRWALTVSWPLTKVESSQMSVTQW